MLSILIPTYNHTCYQLVESLHQQAENLHIDYEIIVAEDGSRDQVSKVANLKIRELSHCQYIRREENVGRARIRNFLASKAKYDWLLFIDSDMIVRSNDYIKLYVGIITANDASDCYYGGYRVGEEALKINPFLPQNLRYRYETSYPVNSNATLRNANPAQYVHTSNLLVRKSVLQKCPFDERFVRYGFEDVLLGIDLVRQGYELSHVDNPLSFEMFESNEAFLSKTEEALRTLHDFQNELEGFSPLLSFAERIKVVEPLLRSLFQLIKTPLRNHLKGKTPSLLIFKVYKLLYFLALN